MDVDPKDLPRDYRSLIISGVFMLLIVAAVAGIARWVASGPDAENARHIESVDHRVGTLESTMVKHVSTPTDSGRLEQRVAELERNQTLIGNTLTWQNQALDKIAQRLGVALPQRAVVLPTTAQ